MGFNPVPATSGSDFPEYGVRIAEFPDFEPTDALLVQMVRMSETDADMWDACKLAVERSIRRLPDPLVGWILDVLNEKRKRPTGRGGAKEDRIFKNLARDFKIGGAVALAAKLGDLDEYAPRGTDKRSACHVVSECLIELDNEGEPAGADLGYEAVKKIWLARRAAIRGGSKGAVDMLTGKPIL